MNIWKVVLAAVAIFAGGVMTGGFGTRMQNRASVARHQFPAQLPAWRGAPRPESRTRMEGERPGGVGAPGWQRFEMFRRYENELGLDPGQRDRIHVQIDEARERVRRQWEPVAPRIRQELRDLRGKIRAELTPDQARRFDELLRENARMGPPRRNPGPARQE